MLLGSINNALMRSEKNHPFIGKLIQKTANDFNPYIWAYNGPKLLNKTLQELCSFNTHTWICNDFDLNLLNYSTVHPVAWDKMELFFIEKPFHFGEETFAIHYYHHFLYDYDEKAKWNKEQALYRLFRQNCPETEEKILRTELLGYYIYLTE